jgi:hypothetical protein
MPTSEDLDIASKKLLGLPEQFKLCHELVLALIQTSQAWVPKAFSTTDYQRCRDQIMQTLQDLLNRIRKMRHETLAPDLVRAFARLTKMYDCCNKCPATNSARITKSEAFLCLIQEQFNKEVTTAFRFVLDEKGAIRESQ